MRYLSRILQVYDVRLQIDEDEMSQLLTALTNFVSAVGEKCPKDKDQNKQFEQLLKLLVDKSADMSKSVTTLLDMSARFVNAESRMEKLHNENSTLLAMLAEATQPDDDTDEDDYNPDATDDDEDGDATSTVQDSESESESPEWGVTDEPPASQVVSIGKSTTQPSTVVRKRPPQK